MIPRLFDKNPYLYEIYPNIEARKALTVFEIYKGKGEWFDLSKTPIERFSFFFGGEEEKESGYFVSSFCSSCGLCVSICPQKAIEIREKAFIHQENCLRCGSCLSICPMSAIKRSQKMNVEEKRIYLIRELIKEDPKLGSIEIPKDKDGQKILLRALMNVREPKEISNQFLEIQDSYLHEILKEKKIMRISSLTPIDYIYIFKGDITTIECGSIVYAANSGMTGCHVPCHNCIDSAIHTYEGIELRVECAEIMRKQGHEQPTWSAKITAAYNLFSRYVIHTVGPIVRGSLREKHCRELESCYYSSLRLADENNVDRIAFCCISTGVFMFPRERAAEIAISTVKRYKAETGSRIKVVFNVYKDEDERIYRGLLS